MTTKECLSCGYAHRSPDPVCIQCGDDRWRLIRTDEEDEIIPTISNLTGFNDSFGPTEGVWG